MTQLRIYSDALNTTLLGLANGLEVAWPNRVYTPKKGVSYLDVQTAGRARIPLGFGADSVQLWSGVYQVGVTVPRDTGDRDQEALAARVLNGFARGVTLATNGGGYIVIEYSTAPGPIVFGDWSVMPVQIHWFATELPP